MFGNLKQNFIDVYNTLNFREKPIPKADRDTAVIENSLILDLMGGFESLNPDTLVQKKGADIYRKMLRDPQVRAAYNLRINIIISRNFRFVKTNDDPVQDEMIDFFKANMDRMLGTWVGGMRSVLLCKAHGFSVTEKLFRTDEWKGKEKWMLKALKAKPFDTFEFKVDKYGNLEKIVQKVNGEEINLNPEKFIYMINHPELDSIWGESDLRSAYKPYWSKDVIEKMMNIYLERMAGGFVVASPTERAQALSPTQKTNFENVLKNISMFSSIIPPLGYDIDIKKADDTEAFEAAIVFYNTEIAKAIMIPDLLGFSERQKVGSRALGEIQLETFMMTLNEDGEYLADTFNEQLWKQLAEWNFGTSEFPRMQFDPFTEFQARKLAGAWISAVEKNAVINTFQDEMRTRELLDYPFRKEEEKDDTVKGELPKEEPEPELPDEPEEPNEPQVPEVKESDKQIKFTEDFTDRVSFADLEKSLDNLESSFEDELFDVVDTAWEEIKTGLKNTFKNLPSDGDKVDFETISDSVYTYISPGTKSSMNRVFKTNFKDIYDLGRSEAQNVLKNAIEDAPKDVKDSIKVKLSLSQYKMSKNRKFGFSDFADGITLQQADSWFKQEAFQQTKNVTESMLGKVQEIILNGIRDKKGYDALVDEMEGAMPEFLAGSGDKMRRARLGNIVQTNMTSIFNQAQLSVFMDPNLGDFIQAFQYSAVLDDRTTVFCEAYNGRIYRKNDPIIGIIVPPNHFRCRSILIPVTILDTWKESKKITGVQPSPGFGGEVE